MSTTRTLGNPTSHSSPSSLPLSEFNRKEKGERGMYSARPIDEDDDLTIRPRRKPPPKTPKQRVILNTITSCLSRSDTPEEVVSVTINNTPEVSFSLHKRLRNQSQLENALESLEDLLDAAEFFEIIDNPQTKDYKDVLPFLITRRTKFLKKRLRVISTALGAMNGEWSTLDIPLRYTRNFSSLAVLRARGSVALAPVDIFDRMFEDCHLLLRSRTVAKAPPRSGAAAAKAAMERFLPLSGGVDYFIKFCRHTFPGQQVRYQWANRGHFED
ncbi:hypothetical protein DFH29DRAFT_965778 [Suillus ampliporus]|nr:hypothetical protein DFH29DRAFT_965778 [Suillus ampliporus]